MLALQGTTASYGAGTQLSQMPQEKPFMALCIMSRQKSMGRGLSATRRTIIGLTHVASTISMATSLWMTVVMFSNLFGRSC